MTRKSDQVEVARRNIETALKLIGCNADFNENVVELMDQVLESNLKKLL